MRKHVHPEVDHNYIIHVSDEDGGHGVITLIVAVSQPVDWNSQGFGEIATLETFSKSRSRLEGEIKKIQLEIEDAATYSPFNPRIHKIYGVSLRQRGDKSTYLMCEVGVMGLGDTYSQAQTTLSNFLYP